MKMLSAKKRLAILQRTRSLLSRKGGWFKGGFSYYKPHLDDTPYTFCIAGAANSAYREIVGRAAEGYDVVQMLSIDALAAAKLAESYPQKAAEVANGDAVATYAFNDASKTKKRDVLALIDQKIAEVEAEIAKDKS